MRLHVYDIEGKILRELSSKPIRSRQVALYANQVLICKFIQRLSGKKFKKKIFIIIKFNLEEENISQVFQKKKVNDNLSEFIVPNQNVNRSRNQRK